MNYYVMLGIDEDADRETIRSAFRGLVRRYHPDAGAGSSSDAFRRVVEAYETLNDPVRRRAYDRALAQARPAQPISRRLRVVEPLGNRMTAEPIGSPRFMSVSDRRSIDLVRPQTKADELFEELLRFVGIGSSFVCRSRF